MQIYDISLPIDPALAEWPGDTPYSLTWTCTKAGGESVNLGSVSLSLHIGSHADAPYHFDCNGASIDQVSLDPYLGPATVVEIAGKQIIRPEDLDPELLSLAPRLLIKTDTWINHSKFPESIPTMSADVPAHFRRHGIVLVGLDVPSVDPIDSKTLVNHHALHARGIRILESLYLKEVPAGQYELIALPLRLVGADASPVRAVLRSV